MVTPEVIRTHVKALFSAWNRQTTPEAFLAFELALGDLSPEQVTYGVTRAIREGGDHPPSAGQVRAFCVGKSRPDMRAKAAGAFCRLDRFAREVGVEGNPRDLDDPLILHALGAIGGWSNFCQRIDEWQQRNFMDAYCEAGSNPQLEEVAKLQHRGQPVGALPEVRKRLANSLGVFKGGDC